MTKPKKLNSEAKAFVPSSQLKASAAEWTPTSTSVSTSTGKTAASVVAASTPPAAVPPIVNNAPSENPTESPQSNVIPATTKLPAKPAPSVWGKHTSSAIREAPTQEQKAAIEGSKAPSGQGGGAGQRTVGQTTAGPNHHSRRHPPNHHHHNHPKKDYKEVSRNHHPKNHENTGNWTRGKKQHQPKHQHDDGWQRGKLVPLDLLTPGEGNTDEAKCVKRILAEELLALRLSFLAPPLIWETQGESDGASIACRWVSDSRVEEIEVLCKQQRLGGDVSRKVKKEHETAPPMEECKPLEINEDTRWTASIFRKEKDKEDSDEVVLKKALLILNKLSLTKFEKLSDAFIETGIGRNEQCLAGAIELIVKKAQDEPHFSSMYAGLCLKLARTPMDFEEPGKNKKFKKMLLAECQKEFETDTNTKIEKAIEGLEDEEEKQLKADLVKKHYLGHMRFIGELYKGDLISIKIMLMVLPQLLEGNVNGGSVDEEKIECFAKLMTVIGLILEQQSAALRDVGKSDASDKLTFCWERVELLAGKKSKGPIISNRIKFMLQDLLEMRANGWTSRRKEESAKTIEQIHKDAAADLRRSSSSLSRSASASSIRVQPSKPVADADGFIEVLASSGGFSRAKSSGNFKKIDSQNNITIAKMNTSPFPSQKDLPRNEPKTVESNNSYKAPMQRDSYEFLEPKQCGLKAVTCIKEYFVTGDADEVILTLQELIGYGNEGAKERAAKVVESCIFMALEMKVDDVEKFLQIIVRCYNDKKLEKAAIAAGLDHPFESLIDIAIDAPLAKTHMVAIFASFVKCGAIPFNYLLETPQSFRAECGAATFGVQVLKSIGGDALNAKSYQEVIEGLMSDEDKKQYSSASNMIASKTMK